MIFSISVHIFRVYITATTHFTDYTKREEFDDMESIFACNVMIVDCSKKVAFGVYRR